METPKTLVPVSIDKVDLKTLELNVKHTVLYSDNSKGLLFIWEILAFINITPNHITHIYLPQEEESKWISDEEINAKFPEGRDANNGRDYDCYRRREGAKWVRSLLCPPSPANSNEKKIDIQSDRDYTKR